MHMESLVLDVPTSNFVRYLAVYGLDLQNVQAFFLATKGVPYGTKEEFLTAMGTLPDASERWAEWQAQTTAAIGAYTAAFRAQPLEAAFGGFRTFSNSQLPPEPIGIQLPVPPPAWGAPGAPFAGKLCRPSHRSWATTCKEWKCS
jgi:hypothetical protein